MDQQQKSPTETVTANIREIFERFRLPGFDFNSFIEARQADIDAMSRATSRAPEVGTRRAKRGG